jgi:hypothetical protein
MKAMPMNEFFLVFHRDDEIQPSPERIQIYLKTWQQWLVSLAAQNILASQLKRWDIKGRVLNHEKKVTESAYTELNRAIDGIISVYATDYEEAKEIARGCPVLELGGIVEIRMAV